MGDDRKVLVVPLAEYAVGNQPVGAGVDLANQFEAHLTLIHVVRHADLRQLEQELLSLQADENVAFTKRDLLELVGRDVLDKGEKLARDRGVAQLHIEAAEGHPAQQIVRYAEASGADLIVVGSRGLSDLPGLLLGSVSHKVIHLAAVPVLVVR